MSCWAAALLWCGLLLAACGNEPEEPIPEFKFESHIAVNADMSISGTLVDTFGEPYYNANELLAMMGEEAVAYNAKTGSGRLRAEAVTTEQGMVNATLRFSGREAYADYNGAVFFLGTVQDALDNGMPRDVVLMNIGDRQKALDVDGLLKLKNVYIVITNEHAAKAPLTIETFGPIQYISAGVEKWYGKNSVRIIEPSDSLVYIVFKEK
jgi:hypothetical protein